MAKIATKNIREAIDCVWKNPSTNEYQVQPGRRRGFRRQAISIAEDLNLDNDEHQLSKHGVVELAQEILIETGKKNKETDGKIDYKEEFENQKQEIFSDILGDVANDYEIVFPLNLQVLGSMPDELDLGETNLERIRHKEWQKDYLQPALENESSNFKSFYNENPNHPDRNKWSYWRIVFPARDPLYAIFDVQDTLQLMMAEINFINHQWSSSMPRPAGSDRAPRDRWSHLQLPFVFLAFHDDEFERYDALDYDYRGGLADRTFMPNIEDFDSLPGFYRRESELNDLEELIANTLVAFQDGITEPIFRRSFFDFWRGIERLAGGDGLNNKDIVDRSRFALQFMIEPKDELRPEIEEAISELDTTRNKLTHDWPEVRIFEKHRDAAKLLLESLIALYIEHQNEYNQNDFQNLLKYGTMTQSEGKIEQVITTLGRLDVIDEEM